MHQSFTAPAAAFPIFRRPAPLWFCRKIREFAPPHGPVVRRSEDLFRLAMKIGFKLQDCCYGMACPYSDQHFVIDVPIDPKDENESCAISERLAGFCTAYGIPFGIQKSEFWIRANFFRPAKESTACPTNGCATGPTCPPPPAAPPQAPTGPPAPKSQALPDAATASPDAARQPSDADLADFAIPFDLAKLPIAPDCEIERGAIPRWFADSCKACCAAQSNRDRTPAWWFDGCCEQCKRFHPESSLGLRELGIRNRIIFRVCWAMRIFTCNVLNDAGRFRDAAGTLRCIAKIPWSHNAKIAMSESRRLATTIGVDVRFYRTRNEPFGLLMVYSLTPAPPQPPTKPTSPSSCPTAAPAPKPTAPPQPPATLPTPPAAKRAPPETCGTCRFFRNGCCRRNPPAVHDGFPKTRADLWCGSFERARPGGDGQASEQRCNGLR